MVELSARASLRGGQVDLRITAGGGDDPRTLQVVRRRPDPPERRGDGLVVLDVGALFDGTGTPWARVVHRRFHVAKAVTDGGLCRAELSLFYAAGASVPSRLSYSSDAGGGASVPLVRFTEESQSPGKMTLTGFSLAPGGGEQVAVRVEIQTATSAGAPLQVGFVDASGSVTLEVDFEELQHVDIDVLAHGPERSELLVRTRVGSVVLRTARVRIEMDELVASVEDAEPSGKAPGTAPVRLDPGVAYAYSAFLGSAREAVASTLATGRHGHAERLYESLPAVHRNLDEPTAEDAGRGQLRRFLEAPGAALDQVESLNEALAARHDARAVGGAHLPNLAHLIGWDTDRAVAESAQRADILFAPRIFSSVGTRANVAALVHRATGWESSAHELGDKLFRTNAPEQTESSWLFMTPDLLGTAPVGLTGNGPAIEGRPAALRDGAGRVWVFFHAALEGSGQRRLFLYRPGMDERPVPALPPIASPIEAPLFHDQDPAVALASDGRVVLFWASTRDGTSALWTCSYDPAATPSSGPTPPTRITRTGEASTRPAAVVDAKGHLRVYWQQARSGGSDLWTMTKTDAWGAPRRLVAGANRAEWPAAVLVDGEVRVLWSADSGDRSRIVTAVDRGRVTDTDTLSGARDASGIDVDPRCREEAPSAVLLKGRLGVVFHANRRGRWSLWLAQAELPIVPGGFTVTGPLHRSRFEDKEPSAVISPDGEALQVYFKSQRKAAHTASRTVDTRDAQALARRGTAQDDLRYLLGEGAFGPALPGAMAIRITTPDRRAPTDADRATLARARAFVEPFRPLNVTYHWVFNAVPID